ncbi:MAG: molybdopterin-dependent oxidoreductase [Thermodesulfobacteriota bacterium]
MGDQLIKLSIDGMKVEIEQGRTILEAARSVGIKIPSLCYDSRIAPFGACRLCVVEQKGSSELIPSCFTPVRSGMEIFTHSPKVIESRRLQLQLILLNHPMICPRCEKEGECELQRLVYEYGLGETQYPWESMVYPVDEASPLLKRDSNKCILCGRCVRICDEIQGVAELSFAQRGIKCVVDTDFHRPLRCEFCGQCMDTCPVGAITTECFDYKAKLWESLETTTPCPYCGCGCLLTLVSKEGAIKRVYSDPEKGPNDGNLCVRGRFGWDFVDSQERIRSPLLRLDGILKEVSWEEALRAVSNRLESIRNRYGSDSIGLLLSARLTNEEYFLFKKLFVETIGTNEIVLDGGASELGLADGLLESLGFGASTNSIREIREAETLLVIGVDPSATHPIVKNEIHLALRRNRANLIVVGSYDILLSGKTRVSPLQPPSIPLLCRPTEEVSLLNAMVGFILEEGLWDEEFIKNHTEGFDDLLKKKEEYLEWANRSSLHKADLRKAVESFLKSRRGMVLIGPGPWSYGYSKKLAMACVNLLTLTGHLGRPSSGILLLMEKCNTQGMIDLRIPFLKGGLREMERKIDEGRLKGLYAVGGNPPSSWAKLNKLEFLVVQDLFMNDLSEKVDVFLPVSSFIEKSGTYTSLERRIQRLHPLRTPLGQSRSDFDIFRDLLRHFEVPLSEETSEDLFKSLSKELPSYQDVEDKKQWPKGLRFLSKDYLFQKKIRLSPLSSSPTSSSPEGYPFLLISRASLFQSGRLSLRSENLKKVMEKPILEMNREEGQTLNIKEGDWVKLRTLDGRMMKFSVHLSPNPSKGILLAYSPIPIDLSKKPLWVKIESNV